ncbi:MAG: DNA alkylation repair protein [Chloroflexi bacterium]|nr:DNA alkylation repair protein [Chloroflexota bacterium]
MKSEFQFRDVFNPDLVNELAGNIAEAWKPFDRQGFVDAVVPQLPALGFGARSSLIADTLHKHLPDDFPSAARILIAALGPEPETDSLSGFDGFVVMPQCLFVSRYGIGHFDAAIAALYEMTKRFTAEGDIRPFIQKCPEKTMAFLHKITQDESPFARRLASEGTRPRLPLAPRLPRFQRDPTPVLALLEKLKADPNLMVRRSVANNLNDIAKDNPDIVVATLERWQRADSSKEMQWIISHALRTLLKQGHPGALRLLGYDPDVQIIVSDIHLSSERPAIGDEIAFSFTVTSGEGEACKLMIDYVVHFMKANGKQAPKVFKAAKKTIGPGETITIEKRHSFQQRSTRVHYPGQHSLEVQINGKGTSRAEFVLV